MRLYSWNVNGLRACMNKGFADFLAAADPDVICLQETKMQREQATFDFPGYEEYWNSAEKKGYSGTAIYAKHEPLSVSYGLGIDIHDHEGRVITLEYPDFYLITEYVPNSQEPLEGEIKPRRLGYRMQWEDDFRDYMMSLDAKKPVIVCGDLNVAHKEIDLKNPKTNHNNAGFTDEEREKMTQLLDSGYIDTFRACYPEQITYSWWSYRFRSRARNTGWRLDYFLISERMRDKIQDAKIHTEIFGSDHCPVELELAL